MSSAAVEILKIWLPIIFSFVALTLSFSTLVWTIYKDTIRKPKFRVSLSLKRIHRNMSAPSAHFVSLEALNLGPAPNRVMSVYGRESWWRRQITNRGTPKSFIAPDFAHEAASPVAMRVEVGDRAILVFPFRDGIFLSDKAMKQIGVVDGFGKTHWAPTKQLLSAQAAYGNQFCAGRPNRRELIDELQKSREDNSSEGEVA